MKVENFTQQNEFNDKILEILQNHFNYEETSRQMVEALSQSMHESRRMVESVTKLANRMNGKQTVFGLCVGAITVLGYRKIKQLEERLEKLEEG